MHLFTPSLAYKISTEIHAAEVKHGRSLLAVPAWGSCIVENVSPAIIKDGNALLFSPTIQMFLLCSRFRGVKATFGPLRIQEKQINLEKKKLPILSYGGSWLEYPPLSPS